MRGYQFHILIMPTGSSAQKIGYPLLSYARERGKGREVEKGGISYKSKTDKRKPHSGIIKTLLEEVARLLSEHSIPKRIRLEVKEKTYNKNDI